MIGAAAIMIAWTFVLGAYAYILARSATDA